MNVRTHHALRFHTLAAVAVTVLAFTSLSAAARAGDVIPKDQAQANYQKERADCLAGRTGQIRSACLKEASAALQEARRGGLTTPSPEQMASNAEQRCQAQPEEERIECRRMAMGEGSMQGSVAQGGLSRELATMQRDPPAAGPTPRK
jgi:hypothetical protein